MSARKRFGALLLVVSVAGACLLPVGRASAVPSRNPVIIVGGLTSIPPVYALLQGRLQGAGFDVSIWTMPDLGLGDIHANAQRFKEYADGVRARTGSAKVDLVAHSMGGLVSRDYVKTLGGSGGVDKLVMVGTPNYGTALASLATFFFDCLTSVGCQQMAIGSSYLNDLNAGDDSIAGVRYTAITTIYDELVIPSGQVYLDAGDGDIANVTVQSQCWFRAMGHIGLVTSGVVADGIADALRGGPVRMNCWAV